MMMMVGSDKEKNMNLAESRAMEDLALKALTPVQNALAINALASTAFLCRASLGASLPFASSGLDINVSATSVFVPQTASLLPLPRQNMFYSVNADASKPALLTPCQLLQSHPAALSVSVSSGSAKNEVKVFQAASSMPPPSDPVPTHEPMLPLPSEANEKRELSSCEPLQSFPTAFSSFVPSGSAKNDVKVFQAASSQPSHLVPVNTQEPILSLPSEPNEKKQKQNVTASQGGFVCYLNQGTSQVASNQVSWEESNGAAQRFYEILGDGLKKNILGIRPADSLRAEGALSYQWQSQLFEPDMNSPRQLSFKNKISEENNAKLLRKESRWEFILQNLTSSSSNSDLVLHSESVHSTDEGSGPPGMLLEYIPLRPVIPAFIPLPIQENIWRKGVPFMEVIRTRFLVSKTRESAEAELYFWDNSVVCTLRVDDWANCGFIASNPNGWFLLLRDDGSLFFFDLKWGQIVRLPSLPVDFQKEKCLMLGSGWKGTFTYEPHDSRNITVLIGSVCSLVNGRMSFVVLSLENKQPSWNVFCEEVLFNNRAISGPLVYLKRNMVVWVSGGNMLETFVLGGEILFGNLNFSVSRRSLPLFEAGSSPVNLIIRYGWLYLFQDTGQRFNPSIYKLDLRETDLEIVIGRPPVNFFMLESSRGWPEDWEEEEEDDESDGEVDDDDEGSEADEEESEDEVEDVEKKCEVEEVESESEVAEGEEVDLETRFIWMTLIMYLHFMVPHIDPVPVPPKYLLYANTSGKHLATCFYTHFSFLNAWWETWGCPQCKHEFAYVGDLPG